MSKRGFVVFDAPLPERAAGLGFERIEGSGEIAEKTRVTVVERRNGRCFANRGASLVGPFDASGIGAKSVDHAGRAAQKDMPIDHGGLRVCGDVAIQSEGPFEFELANLTDGEAGGVGGLEARIVECGAPPVPREAGDLAQADGAFFAKGLGLWTGLRAGRARDTICDRFAFFAAQGISDGHHNAGVHGAQDSQRRHFLE